MSNRSALVASDVELGDARPRDNSAVGDGGVSCLAPALPE